MKKIVQVFLFSLAIAAFLPCSKVFGMKKNNFFKVITQTLTNVPRHHIKIAAIGFLPPLITSLCTKTQLQKLWLIPVGLTSWYLTHAYAKNHHPKLKEQVKEKCDLSSKVKYDFESTNRLFGCSYIFGMCVGESINYMKNLVRYRLAKR